MAKSTPPTVSDIEVLLNLVRRVSNPKKVLLFGSTAANRFTRHSDIDLLIALDDQADCLHVGMDVQQALFDSRYPYPVDVVPVFESDLEKYGQIGGLIYHEALTKGEVIYDATASAA